ncbi:MAG: acyltransferase [Scytonematopsis contorta HA4267-MV1]|jgi:peptidoglycan/LPS O-acetylase OafA/YrhL|nr:acyltransferase [Scytonematopsis contorta HA4267-MV1]
MHKSDKTKKRFLFIDALRGIAAILVTFYHFYEGGPIKNIVSGKIPSYIDIFFANGWVGVQIFFVISGFVIAHSFKDYSITPSFIRNFLWRRAIRLLPPYWVVIFLSISLNYASNFFLTDRTVPVANGNVILANLLLVYTIFGLNAIIPIAWTLCAEIQFYTLFAVSQGIFQKLTSKLEYQFPVLVIVFAPLAIASLFLKSQLITFPLGGVYLGEWYSFFVGFLSYLAIYKNQHKIEYFLYSYLAIMITILAVKWNLAIAISLATVFIIYLLGKLNHLYDYLNNDWLQYFGKISYSLYLIHTVIGSRIINIGYRFTGNNFVAAIILVILASAVSVLASHLLYIFVEKPVIAYSNRFRYKAQSTHF